MKRHVCLAGFLLQVLYHLIVDFAFQIIHGIYLVPLLCKCPNSMNV
jgi:hypothetical protein